MRPFNLSRQARDSHKNTWKQSPVSAATSDVNIIRVTGSGGEAGRGCEGIEWHPIQGDSLLAWQKLVPTGRYTPNPPIETTATTTATMMMTTATTATNDMPRSPAAAAAGAAAASAVNLTVSTQTLLSGSAYA